MRSGRKPHFSIHSRATASRKSVNTLRPRKVFKPVGWAKPSLARSGSTSKGGRTGEKERSLRRQTPF
jgi:hypothetical protein